jgi:hypothetical protein
MIAATEKLEQLSFKQRTAIDELTINNIGQLRVIYKYALGLESAENWMEYRSKMGICYI